MTRSEKDMMEAWAREVERLKRAERLYDTVLRVWAWTVIIATLATLAVCALRELVIWSN